MRKVSMRRSFDLPLLIHWPLLLLKTKSKSKYPVRSTMQRMLSEWRLQK